MLKESEIPFSFTLLSERKLSNQTPKKVLVMVKKQPPEDVKQLSSLTKSLRDVSSTNNDFTWSSQLQAGIC